MLDGFIGGIDSRIGSKVDRLLREADEAFQANDKALCRDVIEQLYDLFDKAPSSAYGFTANSARLCGSSSRFSSESQSPHQAGSKSPPSIELH